MESNGKCVSKEGVSLGYPTGAIVWGTEGTNGQHSFHQLLHQGTSFIPVDFITCLQTHSPLQHQNRLLVANCIAQSQALLTGRQLDATTDDVKNKMSRRKTKRYWPATKCIPATAQATPW